MEVSYTFHFELNFIYEQIRSWPSCQLESHSKSHIRSLFLNEWNCNESLHSSLEFTEDQLNFIVEQCSLTDSKSVSRFIILLVRSIGR